MEKIDGKGKKMRKNGKKEGTGQKEAHEPWGEGGSCAEGGVWMV